MTTQILTANRLDDGVVVYLAEDGSWSKRIEAAQVARDDEAAADLVAAGEIAEHLCQIVGAYLMKVADNGTWRPLGTRETIRSKGPSILADLGIGT
jgi:hypothetical protein